MNALLVSMLSLAAACAWGAVPEPLPADIDCNPAITAPADYLGYEPGERHITHAGLIGYLRLLDRESDRVRLVEYGRTHGHRALVQLEISSPDNLDRVDSIAAGSRQLADPSKSSQLDLKRMPVVVNLNYSVHGNEPSGANAAPVLAYYLAAGNGPEIEEILRQLVVVLDPCLNPDGLDRFAAWSNDNVGRHPNPDPNTREHREPWPNGRSNYYWFDLNRDWMLLVHPESRARMQRYHHWMPQVVLDFHEMDTDSTYFFQPGVESRTHPLIPRETYQLTERMSQYFATSLDEAGSPYFTRERFDDFYAGKGSTISDLKGAVGILLEQASARGIIQDSDNGPVTLKKAITNQVTTSLACLRGSLEMRQDLLAHTRAFFVESMKEANASGLEGYTFRSPEAPGRAAAFVEVLRGHQIEVEPLRDGTGWFIPIRQPQYRFLLAMVEQRTEFEESIFYDITAWNLPLAYNLDWEAVGRKPDTRIAAASVEPLPRSDLGYLVDWQSLNAPRVLLDLLEADVAVHVAKEPFSLNGQSFGHGTLFIPIVQQPEKADHIHAVLQSGRMDSGARIVPVDTFLTGEGIDLGSNAIVPVEKPRILMAAGPGVATYTAGAVWHLFDVLHGQAITLIEPDRLEKLDLSGYTALILPGASKGTYSDELAGKLSEWRKSGGTVVCLGSASKWAIESGLVELELVKKPEPVMERRPFGKQREDKALASLPGAIFKAQVDGSHPLAYGIAGPDLPVFVSGEDFLKPSPNRYQTPLAFSAEPLLAGYASPDNLSLLAGSAAAVVDGKEKGPVILFGHDPVFRGYWRGTEKLLLNAVLFGPLMPIDSSNDY